MNKSELKLDSQTDGINNLPSSWQKMKLDYLVKCGNQGLNTTFSSMESSYVGFDGGFKN